MNAHLPISRVKIIMQSTPEVESVSGEAVALMAKAAEQFVEHLAHNSYFAKKVKKDSLEYGDLANFIQDFEYLEFIQEHVPRKMKYKDCLAIIENNDSVKREQQNASG